MKKLVFILIAQFIFYQSFATITGPTSTLDIGISVQYTLQPDKASYIGSFVWSVGANDPATVSGNGTICSVIANNQYSNTCTFTLTVKYDYLDVNNAVQSYTETKNLTRYAFVTGPTTVYPGEPYSYILQDACGTATGFCSYTWNSLPNWTGPQNITAQSGNWPTTVPSTTITSGIIGTVQLSYDCTALNGGLNFNSGLTYPIPVHMILHTPPSITGLTTISNCDLAPRTYTTGAVIGATLYKWTYPSGWTGPATTSLPSTTVTPNGVYASSFTISVQAFAGNISSPVHSTVTSFTIASLMTNYTFGFIAPSTANCCASNPGTFQVNNVPNATSYSWAYPTGWTGPATTTYNNAIVNFNGVVKTGTIYCTANGPCRTSSPSANIIVTTSPAVPTLTSIDVTGGSGYLCPQQDIFLHANGNAANNAQGLVYHWSPLGGTSAGPAKIVSTGSGSVTFGVYCTSTGCGTTSNTVTKSVYVLGFNDPHCLPPSPSRAAETTDEVTETDITNKNILIYPNPSNGEITFLFSPADNIENAELTIYSNDGKLVLAKKINSNMIDLNLTDVKEGLYLARIVKSNGEVVTKRIIISK